MKHLDVAVAVVCRDGQILICQRRPSDTFGGLWEFPGGKREHGETIQQCLHRELAEELGISVHLRRALTTITHDYGKTRVRLHPFLCELADGQPRAIQCAQTMWVAALKLRDQAFPPANDALLSEIVAVLGALDAPVGGAVRIDDARPKRSAAEP